MAIREMKTVRTEADIRAEKRSTKLRRDREEEDVDIYKHVNTPLLNLRDEPSMDGAVLCTLQEDEKVLIDNSEKCPDGWVSVVTIYGQYGYCMKRYLK